MSIYFILNFMPESQRMTICSNFSLSPRIWFLGLSGKFGKMCILGLSGIRFGIRKHVYKLNSLISLRVGSLLNVLMRPEGFRTWAKDQGQV